MLLTSLAVSLDTLKKATSKSYAEDITAALKKPVFYINLFKTEIKQPGDSRPTVSELSSSCPDKYFHDLHQNCSFPTPFFVACHHTPRSISETSLAFFLFTSK